MVVRNSCVLFLSKDVIPPLSFLLTSAILTHNYDLSGQYGKYHSPFHSPVCSFPFDSPSSFCQISARMFPTPFRSAGKYSSSFGLRSMRTPPLSSPRRVVCKAIDNTPGLSPGGTFFPQLGAIRQAPPFPFFLESGFGKPEPGRSPPSLECYVPWAGPFFRFSDSAPT